MKHYIDAEPYQWPFDHSFTAEETALVIIDMQTDFCGEGGFIHSMGIDVSEIRKVIPPIKHLLEEVRKIPGFTVIHTREGHRPDLSDLPANKWWRSRQLNAGIGDQGPCGRFLVRGELGWDIIPELTPIQGEPIIDKPGKGAFYGTDLDKILRTKSIKNLIFTGITTDVCVHTTIRDANDRGYECLLLKDCTGATEYKNYLSSLEVMTMQSGLFGCVSDAESVIRAIKG
ncbi:cysteine hydrolase family protein [Aquibacillus albus]|uniref:Nicotinamidase-related amidase n=1 Tax=Aquibacillus albus TaxID=1168171 RepID=A0ABS2MW27_9BACI|nr:isochorismatase family cysteine hydrolase [Aquibacillus albus]MBM7570057.1 nicotinamidase-related amidase [Aquibacillus albus]